MLAFRTFSAQYNSLFQTEKLVHDTPWEMPKAFDKKEGFHKLKKIPFKLIVPKGLTNGASALSGKTNVKNKTVYFYPDEDLIVAQSGSGRRKTFKKLGHTEEGWPICGSHPKMRKATYRILKNA